MVKDFFNLTKLLYSFAPIYAIELTALKLISTVTPIARLYIITDMINQIDLFLSKNTEMTSILSSTGIFILVELVSAISLILYQTVSKKCNLYIKKNKYPEFIEQIAKLEYLHFENSDYMDLIRRIKQNFNVRILLSYTTCLYFLESIITALILIIIITNQVGVAGLLFTFISIPLIVAGQKSAKDLYDADEKAEKYNRYLEYIENLFKDRVTAAERSLFKLQNVLENKWEDHYKDTFIINKKTKIRVLKRALSSDILTFLAYALAIGVLCLALINNNISYGMFIAITISILRLMNTLSYSLSGNLADMGKCKLFMDDYNKLLNLRKETGAIDEAVSGIEFEKIEFIDVSFTYPNAKKATLKDLSLIIERGKKYAFVGENGAGKTTIIKLLLRLYKPDKGEILVNGKAITNYSYGELKGLCSVVFQDYSKYPIPLKESLDLGTESSNDEKKVDILRYVGLDRCIDENNQIIDYELGKLSENSIEFSEGQWQRLSIARALISDRNLLILDEATSSIDPIREKEVYELFKKASNNKTTIFITHRLGSTKFADVIYVLKDGRVIEIGNHESLMLENTVYNEMYNSQSRWYQ